MAPRRLDFVFGNGYKNGTALFQTLENRRIDFSKPWK